VLGSWCDFPGAVPREEIMTVFKDKGKRDKGKEKDWDGTENIETRIE